MELLSHAAIVYDLLFANKSVGDFKSVLEARVCKKKPFQFISMKYIIRLYIYALFALLNDCVVKNRKETDRDRELVVLFR